MRWRGHFWLNSKLSKKRLDLARTHFNGMLNAMKSNECAHPTQVNLLSRQRVTFSYECGCEAGSTSSVSAAFVQLHLSGSCIQCKLHARYFASVFVLLIQNCTSAYKNLGLRCKVILGKASHIHLLRLAQSYTNVTFHITSSALRLRLHDRRLAGTPSSAQLAVDWLP